MGEFTLANYRDEVRMLLGNLPSTDPSVSDTRITSTVNRVANHLIRSYSYLFPEHQNNPFEFGPTVVGNSSFSISATCLTVEKLRHSKDTVITGSDWNDSVEHIVAQTNADTIGVLKKDSAVKGYPSQWARQGNTIHYYPTTRTGYTTYIRYYGLAGEAYISSDASTFTMHKDWDEIIVLLSASRIARKLGKFDLAKELKADATAELVGAFNVEERSAGPLTIESEQMATRSAIYRGFD